jgi:hypothetical protein
LIEKAKLQELTSFAVKWLKNNILLVFFIVFSILKFGWLDDIEEQHYLMGDIDKFEDDFFIQSSSLRLLF